MLIHSGPKPTSATRRVRSALLALSFTSLIRAIIGFWPAQRRLIIFLGFSFLALVTFFGASGATRSRLVIAQTVWMMSSRALVWTWLAQF
jgi:hypothetical protein